MAESYPWFKFNVTKWMLGRIQRLSFAHHGAFLRLLCLYWDKEGEISLEDAELECTTELFADLLKYKIVKKSKEFVQIDFMDELLAEKGDASNQKRDAALERWRLEREKKRNADELHNNADAMHVHTDAMQIRKEEIIEEKKEGKSVPSELEVIEYFEKNGYTKEHAKTVFEYYDGLNWTDKNKVPIDNWKYHLRKQWMKEDGKPPLTREEVMHINNNPPVSQDNWNRLSRSQQHNYNVMHGGSGFPLKDK